MGSTLRKIKRRKVNAPTQRKKTTIRPMLTVGLSNRRKTEETRNLRWLLDCFYELTRCMIATEVTQSILPCLVSALQPRIRPRLAVLLEKRDNLIEYLWHDAAISAEELVNAKTKAKQQLNYFLGRPDSAAPFSLDAGERSGHEKTIIILPLVITQSEVFGMLYLDCQELSEADIALLHALGNHISLAMDRDFQLKSQKIAADELKKMQQEIEKESRFRFLAEALPEMVWTIKQNGEVTYVNRRWTEYSGVSLDHPTCKQWLDFFHKEDRPKMLDRWEKAKASALTFESEGRIRRHDGSYRWHISRAVPERDDQGVIQGWIGTSTDIDEKRRVQEQLLLTNSKLRLLSEIAGAILCQTKPSEIVDSAFRRLVTHLRLDIYVSFMVQPDGKRVLLNSSEEVNAPLPLLLSGHDIQQSICGHTAAQKQITVVENMLEVEKPCADFLRSLNISSGACCPLLSQERLLGILIIGAKQRTQFSAADLELIRLVCDQTAVALDRTLVEEANEKARADLEKARQEADSANQAKSLFLANMSHEIRTPIGVILGFADLASSSAYSEAERRDALRKIKRNGEDLAQLIDDILDISKVEAGRLDIEKSTVDVEGLLNHLISNLHFKACEKGIRLSIETARNIPQHIFTDPLRLKQCLINVIGNAIKFTDHGGVHVKCQANIDSNKRRLLEFIISDTGIGLSTEQIDKLFKNFSQANPSNTRRFGGTGLGLALSRSLAQALGGDLVLDSSEPGKGSTFRLSIDTSTDVPSGVQGESMNNLPQTIPKLDGIRILLVEDSPDNQLLIRRYLEIAGAHVNIASDGQEGIEKALADPYDLVLMDIQMPKVDGYEATARLRQAGYQKPVIALTANAMRGDKERCLEIGFTDHLSKPINPNVLLYTVGHAVRNPTTNLHH